MAGADGGRKSPVDVPSMTLQERKCRITQLRDLFIFWHWNMWNTETNDTASSYTVTAPLAEEDAKIGRTEAEHKFRNRETWSGKFEFFLSCLGYCVGFGNIWRFPFLVYRNGGGAFLIPYIIFLSLCGIPLVLMEMAMGQFSSLTAIHLFGKFSPLFKGVGYSMAIISFFVCIYYNTIMSWVIYYLYSSFSWVLPWTVCDPAWASAKCFALNHTAHPINLSLTNVTLVRNNGESSVGLDKEDRMQIPASEEFWNRHVLRLSTGIDETGSLRPELLLCLAIAWISVFLCSFKGIRASGKVVYVTATCPFIMLIVLLIRGCTLPGAMQGIWLFLCPDFSRLKDFHVWIDAAMQIFYAMAPGWGGLLSFASYNDFHVNVYRYGVAIPIVNFFTSMLCGFSVFSVVGFLAHQSDTPVDHVVAQGPGLTFIAYPEALSQLPFAPAWAVLFFLTLFTIGIDSQFGMFETFLSAICDEFRFLRKYRGTFTALSCLVLFLLGMICVTEGGMYWVQIIDWYCAFMTLMIICIVECVLIGYIYGADRFRRDIALMIGHPICAFWSISWKYLTLATIASILFFNFYFQTPIVYEGYVFPKWSVAVGWTLAVSSSLPIPIYAVWKLSRSPEATLLRRISANIRCRPEYGPLLSVNRQAYLKDLALCPPNFPARRRPEEDDLSAEGEPLSPVFPLVQSTAILIPQPQR
ncbi:hypothetical protein RvY_17028 [Ramazzottius varieornatus]|uniref:Transporter n=1 Tax=Ramazzottius varieornatus TaxID=947166 RepID=A0A1D1W336_RAMVA|nr:hypothetical protein RvY_17028 [Ramazzottius varieornatus]